MVVRRGIRSSWLNKAGLGPTKLISPHKMLNNCGSSSMLVLRRKPPIGVKNRSGSVIRWVAMGGVCACIVRNFGILKITLLRPTRSDQYNTGRPAVNIRRIATKSIGRPRTISRVNAKTISKKRFMILPINDSFNFLHNSIFQRLNRRIAQLILNSFTRKCQVSREFSHCCEAKRNWSA